jgi:hypothetical protein
MIAASAMLVLAQAMTPCTIAGTPRLGGGAVLVRPVTDFAPVPFLQLGPAPSIRTKAEGIQQTGATSTSPEPGPDQPGRQCEAVVSVA